MSAPSEWRLKGQRYSMRGTQCEDCGDVAFPPREVCSHCQASEVVPFDFQSMRHENAAKIDTSPSGRFFRVTALIAILSALK